MFLPSTAGKLQAERDIMPKTTALTGNGSVFEKPILEVID
jgi:hypothetical protein